MTKGLVSAAVQSFEYFFADRMIPSMGSVACIS